jgi:nitrate reductase NapE component
MARSWTMTKLKRQTEPKNRAMSNYKAKMSNPKQNQKSKAKRQNYRSKLRTFDLCFVILHFYFPSLTSGVIQAFGFVLTAEYRLLSPDF